MDSNYSAQEPSKPTWIRLISSPNYNEVAKFERKIRWGPPPPLVFKLDSNSIQMGLQEGGETVLLTNSAGDTSTPFVIGLSDDNHLVYGHEAINCQKKWWPFQLICNGIKINESIQLYNAKVVKITPEFLLAFIFKSLKVKVEVEFTEKIKTCVASVPTWFASNQRSQVRNGLIAGGFQRAYLVNESTAAAYSFATFHDEAEPYKILVFAENPGFLSATRYNYFPRVNRLEMESYCGHYPGTRKVIISNNISPKSSQTNAFLRLLEQVSDDEGDLRGFNLRSIFSQNKVVLITESREWAGRFKRELESDWLISGKYLLLDGLVKLSSRPEMINERVKDRLVFGLILVGANQRVICTSGTPMPFEDKVKCCMPARTNEIAVSQQTLMDTDSPAVIGKLRVENNFVRKDIRVEFHLGISQEGISGVDYVMPAAGFSSRAQLMFKWESSQPNQDELERLRALVEALVDSREKVELLNWKRKLLEKSKRLRDMLDGGLLNSRLEERREEVRNRIKMAEFLALSEETTKVQIWDELESLEDWCFEYLD